jgi:CDP-glucose 4,6-dehydratase
MEKLSYLNKSFWEGRVVLVTGHTGFKGTWLSAVLAKMGADVHGISLPLGVENTFYSTSLRGVGISSYEIDIRDRSALFSAVSDIEPDIVIHMAAQPLVLASYADPVSTFNTNISGLINLLEGIRKVKKRSAIVNVTTDKVYENLERRIPFREDDKLGGFDPYSASKACAEIVTTSYKHSFFGNDVVGCATARSGNVLGGGDWAANRLVPDFFRALRDSRALRIRNKDSVRPWQHVLDPIYGYLLLAQKLYDDPPAYSGAWNFGPAEQSTETVEQLVLKIRKEVGLAIEISFEQGQEHEHKVLTLDATKARQQLRWEPLIDVGETVRKTVEWYCREITDRGGVEIFNQQISEFTSSRMG